MYCTPVYIVDLDNYIKYKKRGDANNKNSKITIRMGKKTDRIVFSPGDILRYKTNPNDEWQIAEVISKAGKSTGRYKNWYNVKHKDTLFYINLDDLSRFERQSNDDLNEDLEFDLRRKWSTLDSPISFSGISKIYEYYNKQISRKEIERILSTIPTYTKYKQRKKSNLHNPFFIYYLHQQWQIDVTYIIDLGKYNDNILYLLIVMECFSRKIFVVPMKSRTSKDVVKCFTKIHLHVGYTPHTIYVDQGSEFNSIIFKNYCNQHNITLIFSQSVTKAALVERSQRTLQGIMFRFMNNFNTFRYIDHLQKIVSTFNSKINRTIKMSPNNAYLEHNYPIVIRNLEKHYNKSLQKKKKPKYKTGNKVRIHILPKEGVFRKGYKPSFTNEIFTISTVNTRLPEPRYDLEDSSNRPIIGSFQANELSIVRNNE